MKEKDVVVGMKVVPHSKSVVGNLSTSNVWNYWGGKEQGYLYVNGKDREGWFLSVNKELNGDYFLASDFEPYKGFAFPFVVTDENGKIIFG